MTCLKRKGKHNMEGMILTPTAMGSTPEKRNDCWGTPQKLFDWLGTVFDFKLDVCADDKNHKCAVYFTEAQDALKQIWPAGMECFMNPPYSRVESFMQKAWEESRRGVTVVSLVPASTETAWYRLAKRRVIGNAQDLWHFTRTDHRGKEWLIIQGQNGAWWESPYRIQFDDPTPDGRMKNPKGSTLFVFFGATET